MNKNKKFEEQYPEKDYQKTLYTFKSQEIAKLSPWDADVQKGEIAKQVILNIITDECFKRVGIRKSPDVGIQYDVIAEQFTLFIPRHWCSLCQNKRAEYSVMNKIYCANCLEILKSQQAKVSLKKQSKNKEEKTEVKDKK